MQPTDAQEASGGKLRPWKKGATPALLATSMEGSKRTLQDYLGKPLILNFWASYCGPCRLEMPAFNMLMDLYSDKGLRVLAVNHGEMPARILQFLKAVPFNGEVLLDRSQTQMKAWSAYALPTSFVIDAKGQVRFWHVGEIDWSERDAQAKIQQVIEG
ncbi:TlpA family protein disulfide reductase [Diaphorobacter aerolatus]|uniref:TlpA family protein disulfide reductase n=1 Tax=Diaphorobacter aerolatus TaxID=1288495 RepID=A0A7H0GGG0_9BURK|nr:TlpA disulfide reductase family protein [Diaphorobacter aerolatus]QNP47376.1 TlpA family protein disulfide reductase [Diaphorobacter aerolatus]